MNQCFTVINAVIELKNCCWYYANSKQDNISGKIIAEAQRVKSIL